MPVTTGASIKKWKSPMAIQMEAVLEVLNERRHRSPERPADTFCEHAFSGNDRYFPEELNLFDRPSVPYSSQEWDFF